MQALKLKPWFGWTWIRAGWRLFRRQPLAFVALLFFYWLLLLSASAVIGWIAHGLGLLLPFASADLIALFGSVLVALFTPALTVGFMQACRSAEALQPVHPLLLFAPFRSGKKTLGSLLTLGAIQMVALVCIVFLTSGLDTRGPDQPNDNMPVTQGAVSKPAESQTAPSASGSANQPADRVTGQAATQATGQAATQGPAQAATEADQEAIRREATTRAIQGLAYLPVAVLMWYAPMLAAWHRLSAGKALFFSAVAVWRNLGAFFLYGIAWLAIWMCFSFAIGLVASLIGVANLAAVLALPLVMLMLTWMYCSVYPSYATVFVDHSATPAPATPSVEEGSDAA